MILFQQKNIMQVKIFTIPIIGGERVNEEMNTFLRSKKVLQIEKEFLASSAAWSFEIPLNRIGALAPTPSIGMSFNPYLKERSSDTVYLMMFERRTFTAFWHFL